MTLVPRIIDRNNLANAIAVHGINFNSARLIGPALAGLLIQILSFEITIFINFLFLIAMPLTLVSISVSKKDGEPGKIKNILLTGLIFHQPII